MNEVASIKKCNSCDEGKKGAATLKKHIENHDHHILERAKTFKDCVAACPEFDYVESLKTIYCIICLTKKEFEELDDYNKKPGVITFVGDYGEENYEQNYGENDEGIEKVTVPRDLSNIKVKIKHHLES